MRVTLVTAIVVVALAGASCVAERTLDVESLESTLQQQLQERQVQMVDSVACPDEIKVEAKATFQCTATGDETTWTLQVRQNDDDGNVTWKIVDAT
jgi:hypothetical protein